MLRILHDLRAINQRHRQTRRPTPYHLKHKEPKERQKLVALIVEAVIFPCLQNAEEEEAGEAGGPDDEEEGDDDLAGVDGVVDAGEGEGEDGDDDEVGAAGEVRDFVEFEGEGDGEGDQLVGYGYDECDGEVVVVEDFGAGFGHGGAVDGKSGLEGQWVVAVGGRIRTACQQSRQWVYKHEWNANRTRRERMAVCLYIAYAIGHSQSPAAVVRPYTSSLSVSVLFPRKVVETEQRVTSPSRRWADLVATVRRAISAPDRRIAPSNPLVLLICLPPDEFLAMSSVCRAIEMPYLGRYRL